MPWCLKTFRSKAHTMKMSMMTSLTAFLLMRREKFLLLALLPISNLETLVLR